MKKVQHENLADEITVNVFSKVLSKLYLYDFDFQFKTWVLTIAQNTIIDYWRKKAREAEDTDGNLEEVKNEFAKSPEELLISEEEHKKIQDIVSTMDANYAEIIRTLRWSGAPPGTATSTPPWCPPASWTPCWSAATATP